jgi:pimeloyl-ACP methyl ester carboxylesterase
MTDTLRHVHRLALCADFLFIIVLSSCGTLTSSDEQLVAKLQEAPMPARIQYTTVDDWTVRSLEAGNPEHSQVVLIHGAPGSLDAFSAYFGDDRLVGNVHLVGVDRPGYGGSQPGRIETSVRRQAQLLRPLIRPGAILVGHSYGGTTAVRLAMDYPDLVGGLVIVAGSMSPEDERLFFFNRPMQWPVFNWIMSRSWRMANAEKVTRVEELRTMLPLWQQITAPTVLIHGTNDSLVPYPHSPFAESLLTSASVRLITLEGGSHFILWSERDRIVDAILSLLPSSN